jgi:hypothetical protein
LPPLCLFTHRPICQRLNGSPTNKNGTAAVSYGPGMYTTASDIRGYGDGDRRRSIVQCTKGVRGSEIKKHAQFAMGRSASHPARVHEALL